ncbi:Holliday junction branch migration protein RuvA [Candidatus Gottesmanbacteria bacterium]|nr:Holliday junction branch migration protein RuvA [Candidatus Gottesmanbacteria bacterium]
MINYLEGTVKFKNFNSLILFTHGVGYKVFVPPHIVADSQLNQEISLFIFTYVKEDALDLYGFATPDDLALFELFLTISGIGPKTAVSVFSNKSERIKEAIVKGDVEFFMTVPRLGRKNAQKIIIELRPKLGSIGILNLAEESGETKEILDALKTFGFSATEAKEAVKSLRDVHGTTSDKIRQALKFLGKK